MKIALLSSAGSIHTVRWANGLSAAGHEVHLISQQKALNSLSSAVQLHQFRDKGRAGYFLMVPKLRRLLTKVRPDIVNAHYASGYGTTARLLNYRPWIMSVWGSDVYDFPNKSPLHKWLVRKNLLSADQIASTSQCMAKQTKTLLGDSAEIEITPFGTDLALFEDGQAAEMPNGNVVVIGTVKTMKPVYGISTLIEAYALLVKRLNHNKKKKGITVLLRLVGGGEQTSALKALAGQLGVSDTVTFIGQVPHNSVPKELLKLDIYVALSERESFGVAVIEAEAASRPVVVSNVGGLPEVTVHGKTGFVVPRGDPEAAADALERLVLDSNLRQSMGRAGREYVATNYSWNTCVERMLIVYENTIQTYRSS